MSSSRHSSATSLSRAGESGLADEDEQQNEPIVQPPLLDVNAEEIDADDEAETAQQQQSKPAVAEFEAPVEPSSLPPTPPPQAEAETTLDATLKPKARAQAARGTTRHVVREPSRVLTTVELNTTASAVNEDEPPVVTFDAPAVAVEKPSSIKSPLPPVNEPDAWSQNESWDWSEEEADHDDAPADLPLPDSDLPTVTWLDFVSPPTTIRPEPAAPVVKQQPPPEPAATSNSWSSQSAPPKAAAQKPAPQVVQQPAVEEPDSWGWDDEDEDEEVRDDEQKLDEPSQASSHVVASAANDDDDDAWNWDGE